MTPEQMLISHILTNHTTEGRPVDNPLDTVTVTLDFYISELISVVKYFVRISVDVSINDVPNRFKVILTWLALSTNQIAHLLGIVRQPSPLLGTTVFVERSNSPLDLFVHFYILIYMSEYDPSP